MTPAEWAAVAAAIQVLAQLTEEGISAVDAWIHSGGDEQRQVVAARAAENAAVDAYQAVKNEVKP